MAKTLINIDSRHRNTTDFSNSNDFNYPILNDSSGNNHGILKNVVSIKLKSIESINAGYFINSTRGNNTFTIGGGDVTLADGNYNIATLISTLNADSLMTSEGVVATYNQNLNKIIFTFSGSKIFNFDNTTSYPSLGELLGFHTTGNFTSTTFTFTNSISQMSNEYFYLYLSNLGNLKYNNRNYFAKILFTEDYDTNNTEYRFPRLNSYISDEVLFTKPEDIMDVRVKVYDYLGNLIDLNGTNFSFTLEFNTVHNSMLKYYREDTFFNRELLDTMFKVEALDYFKTSDNNHNGPYEKKMNNFFGKHNNF
jgi:hypothetical protein